MNREAIKLLIQTDQEIVTDYIESKEDFDTFLADAKLAQKKAILQSKVDEGEKAKEELLTL